MNSYFQNLIERNTKAQGDIRPRVSSVFESGAPQLMQPVPDLDAEENETAATAFQAAEKRSAMRPVIPAAFRPSRFNENGLSDTGADPEKKSALTNTEEEKVSPPTDISPSRPQTQRGNTVVESLQNVSRLFISRTRAAEAMTSSAEKTSLSPTLSTSGKTDGKPRANEASSAETSAGKSFFPNGKATDGRSFQDGDMETSAPVKSKAFRIPDDGSSPASTERANRVAPLISKHPDIRPLQTSPAAGRQAGPDALPFPTRAEPEKTIRVTIGRIDVRAIMPPSPVPAARPKETQPKISLEDYLKKQRGGSR